MAMTAYTGVMGSGKTYEVVDNVILPALSNGRRVCTNVAGLKIEKIQDYIFNTRRIPVPLQGKIVQFSNDDVTKSNFFPVEGSDNLNTIIQGGDLVVIDECWRWFATGERLASEHMKYFRMHRQFTNEKTGLASDVVLIVQSIEDLQRKVKLVVEKTFLMHKHKDLGMPDRYVVQVYTGNRPSARSLTESFQRKYDPDIYNLYSSYSQQKGNVQVKEIAADRRGNIFNTPLIKYGLPVGIIFIGVSAFYVWKFFNPDKKQLQVSHGFSQVVTQESPPNAIQPVPHINDVPTSSWRLVGRIHKNSDVIFILQDSSGRVRYVQNPFNYQISQFSSQVTIENGEVVTPWTGTVPVIEDRKS